MQIEKEQSSNENVIGENIEQIRKLNFEKKKTRITKCSKMPMVYIQNKTRSKVMKTHVVQIE